jgi:hypothetical protein
MVDEGVNRTLSSFLVFVCVNLFHSQDLALVQNKLSKPIADRSVKSVNLKHDHEQERKQT